MKRFIGAVVVASACLLAIACDKKPEKSSDGGSGAASSEVADPAGSFKAFAASFHSAARTELEQPWDGEFGSGSLKMSLFVFNKYDVDVRKTDSLISPYLGVLNFKAQQADDQRSLGGTT